MKSLGNGFRYADKLYLKMQLLALTWTLYLWNDQRLDL